MSDKNCQHEDVDIISQDWVSGDTIEFLVECRYCGKRGSITIDINPGLVQWQDDDDERVRRPSQLPS
jgi:hypothetical protein